MEEIGIDEAKALPDLRSAGKLQKLKIPNLQVLKKSKFYSLDDKLREHIGTYRGYAIMLKQESLREEHGKEVHLNPSLIQANMLGNLKKVNGNTIRKMQPKTLHESEKLSLFLKIQAEIDTMIERDKDE
jgi:hypothetical protein